MRKFNLTVFCILCLLVMVLLVGCEAPDSEGIDQPNDPTNAYAIDHYHVSDTQDMSFLDAVDYYCDRDEILDYVENNCSLYEKLDATLYCIIDDSGFHELPIDDSYTMYDLVDIYGVSPALAYYGDHIDPGEVLENAGIYDVWELIDAVGAEDAATYYEEGTLEGSWDGWDSLEYWYRH